MSFWRKRSTLDKILISILTVLIIILIIYLIWKLIKHLKGRKEKDIDELQQKYTRYRFPYVTLIRDTSKPENTYHCLAAVTARSFVTTLASCVDKNGTYEIYIGKYYIDQKDKDEINITVREVMIHPRYKTDPERYNTAMLLLGAAIPFGDAVCLAYVGNITYDQEAVVHGWGNRLSNPSSNEPGYMRTTTFKLSSGYCKGDESTCKGPLKPKFTNKYCIGNPGSPIVQEKFPRQILVGLAVSPQYPCYQGDKPPVMFQSIHFERDFISDDDDDNDDGSNENPTSAIPDKNSETSDKKPDESDKSPEKSDQMPGIADEKLEKSDKIPDIVDKKPERSDKKPDIVDKKPDVAEKKPEKSDKKPEKTDKKPEKTDKKPEKTDKKPEKSDKKPETKTEIPKVMKNPPDKNDDIKTTTQNISTSIEASITLARDFI